MRHNLNFIYDNWLVITAALSVVIIFFSFFSVTSHSMIQSTDKYLHTAAYFFLSLMESLEKLKTWQQLYSDLPKTANQYQMRIAK